MVIELIGGVGAGKSRVLRILREEYGAAVIETDQIATELERKGQEGWRRLTEAFGEGILGADGELDRKKLAEIIFSDPPVFPCEQGASDALPVLAHVNQMIHPLVWEKVYRKAAEFRGSGSQDANGRSLLVVETALPEEKKPDDIYDEVWYVYTLEETRIRRLMESRGYSCAKCLAVMGRQPSEDEYRALADRVLDNNGDEENLRRQIASILTSLAEHVDSDVFGRARMRT